MFRIKDKTQYLTQIEEVIARGPYHDTWDSLTDFEMPGWFSKAKFGIFLHWGLYSVPAFSNEWYSRNMYVKDSPEYEHHIRTFERRRHFVGQRRTLVCKLLFVVYSRQNFGGFA